MKILTPFLLAAFAAGTVQIASAINYSPSDVLLVFRESGFNDVEFDLGPVSQFKGLSAGTKVPVSYDQSLVTGNFGGISGVDFLLVAATSTSGGADPNARVWSTDKTLTTAAPNPTGSQLSNLRGKIEGVGLAATAVTSSNSLPLVVSPASQTSYDYIASDGTGVNVNSLGGVSDFPVESAAPTTLAFYELSWTSPGSPATLIGAFTLDAAGNLYFTAGQLPPLAAATLTQITSVGGFNTISFTTTLGVNYQLYSATDAAGPWMPVSGATAWGDGTEQSLFDFSLEPTVFYRLESTY